MRKTLLIVLSVIFLNTTLISCSSTGENIISFDYSKADVSSDVQTESGNNIVSVEGTNVHYTARDFYNFYKLQKDNFISYVRYYESMGYVITDNGAAVGDTEEFWSANSKIMDDDGKEMTFAEYFYDYVVEVFKGLVAKKIVAEKYDIEFADDFYADLNVSIAEDIVANSLVEDESSIIDDKGNIQQWIMDRWEMHLASMGYDKETWIEFNYTISNIDGYLTEKLEELGAIKPCSEDEAKVALEKMIDEEINNFLNDYVKVKYIAYEYHAKADYENDDSSEISADNAENSNEASLSSEEQAKKYNDELNKKCDAIFESLKSDPSKFDEEMAKCDMAEVLLPDYKDGMIFGHDDYEEVFGEKDDGAKVGDLKIYKTEVGIHILMFVELTEADSGISRTPVEEDINKYIEESVSQAYSELIYDYAEACSVDQVLLDRYKVPWKV